MTDNTPRLRAGDQARHTALERLEWAFRDGQIDFAELQERTEKAQKATYIDELPALTQDLSLPANLAEPTPHAHPNPNLYPNLHSVPDEHHSVAPNAANNHQPARIDSSAAATGSKLSIGIFGGTDKRGPWTCAPTHTTVAAFGGTGLDFREAILTAETTVVNIGCAFGGVDVIVPDHYQVDVDVLPIFGGTDVTGKPGRNLPATGAGQAPKIIVRGFVAFGGVEVKRVPQ